MRDLGGAVALVLVLLVAMGRRRERAPAPMGSEGWMWPVPTLVLPTGKSYEATVSSGFGSPRDRGTPNEHSHVGLDIMYRRTGVAADVFRRGVRGADGFTDASKGYFAPADTPIVAARPGRVWSVYERDDGGGWTVVIDHGDRWVTYYTHLRDVAVAPAKKGKRDDGGAPEYVGVGQAIGTMGGDRGESSKLRHLHFEARWYEGAEEHERSVDVWKGGKGPMSTWARTTWTPERVA